MKCNFFLIIGVLLLFSFGVQAQSAKSKTEPIAVGAIAPDFALVDQNNKKVTLSKLKKPVVLVFYRGYW